MRSRDGGRDRVERFDDRLGLHHHAAAAAVRGVVGRAVAVVGVLAEVDQRHLQQPGVARALRDAGREGRREELGKDRDDVDAHGQSSSPGNRLDDDPAAGEVDRADDVGDQRDQVLRSAVADDEHFVAPVVEGLGATVPRRWPSQVDTSRPSS